MHKQIRKIIDNVINNLNEEIVNKCFNTFTVSIETVGYNQEPNGITD